MKKQSNGRQIFITDFDLVRLENLIEDANRRSSRDGKYLEELEQELIKAEVVTPAGIPPDVITMNSRVCLQDMDSGENLVYTLVFPGDADFDSGKISVLAPIGTALIGYRAGAFEVFRARHRLVEQHDLAGDLRTERLQLVERAHLDHLARDAARRGFSPVAIATHKKRRWLWIENSTPASASTCTSRIWLTCLTPPMNSVYHCRLLQLSWK